jgi:hypothetical protein
MLHFRAKDPHRPIQIFGDGERYVTDYSHWRKTKVKEGHGVPEGGYFLKIFIPWR